MAKKPLLTLEEQTIAPIPQDQRSGKSSELVAIWFGVNMTPITVVTGALATTICGLSLWWALIAAILGHALGGIMALHAAQGPRLGVPQMLQVRGQFGSYRAALIILIAALMFIGFFSSHLVVATSSFAAIAPNISSQFVLVLASAVSLIIAAFGYVLVRRATAVGSYAVGALVVISLAAIAVNAHMTKMLTVGGCNAQGFFATIAFGVVWQIAYAPYVSDYSRYMPVKTGSRRAKAEVVDLAGASELPDEAIYTGAGWHGDVYPGGFPDRREFNSIMKDRPVVLDSHDAPGVWVNSRVLESARVVTTLLNGDTVYEQGGTVIA